MIQEDRGTDVDSEDDTGEDSEGVTGFGTESGLASAL